MFHLRQSTDGSGHRDRVAVLFQPPGPHSWGDIRELGDTPKPSAASCCTSSVIPAKLVLVKTGSGNPGVDVGRAKRSETRRHSLPFNLPGPNPLSPPLWRRHIQGNSEGTPSGSRREASLPLTPASLQRQDGHAQESGRESAQCHDVYPDVTDPPAPQHDGAGGIHGIGWRNQVREWP